MPHLELGLEEELGATRTRRSPVAAANPTVPARGRGLLTAASEQSTATQVGNDAKAMRGLCCESVVKRESVNGVLSFYKRLAHTPSHT